MCMHLKMLQRVVLLSATLLHCSIVQMPPIRFCSTAARVVPPCAGIRSPHKVHPIITVNSGVIVQKRSSTACCASKDDANPFDPAALVGSYQFAESTCYLSAVILTAFPDLVFLPLMPLGDLPSFALASAATAGRVEAAWLVLLGSMCGCLADASAKGNLTKSDTYKRLNLAVLLGAASVSTLTLGAYVLAENMRSPWLLLVMAFALAPVLPASFQGLQAQGLDNSEFLTSKVPQDAQELGQACITIEQPLKPLQTFYQSQLVLGLLVGVLLVALPSVIVEAPEPNYTAETLMRRCSGLGAAIPGATVIWSLMGAANRGRLGASTFVQLNLTMGIVNVAIGFWIAWLATECTDTTALGAVPLSLIGVAPGSVYLYQALEGANSAK